MKTQDNRPVEDSESLDDHRLLHRRMGAALLEGDAEAGPSAMARLGGGAIAGVFVTVAVVALVGIIAILRPGGATAWQQPGAFIVAEETGSRFVYRDGLLSPIANYASAKLLLGNDLHVVNVSMKSLAAAPQGVPIGIPMAPDSLPDATGMVGTDWSVCATGSAVGTAGLEASVLPGQYAQGQPLSSDDAFLLRTGDGRNYLVWAAHAYQIADRWLPAVGLQLADARLVDDEFIAALPVGRPIAPPVVDGIGQAVPALPGMTEVHPVGTVFGDLNNAFYVLTQDGLAGLTQLQAKLLLADPALSPAYSGGNPTPLPISAAQVTAAAIAPLTVPGNDAAPPAAAPTLTAWPAGEQQLCLRWADQRQPELVIGPATDAGPDAAGNPAPAAGSDPSTASGPAARGDPTTGGEQGAGGGSVVTPDDDLVRLPTNGGALAAAAGPGADTSIYLVTADGTRYPVAGQQSLEQLGLTGVSIARVPAAVLDLLRLGVTLDVAAAGRPMV